MGRSRGFVPDRGRLPRARSPPRAGHLGPRLRRHPRGVRDRSRAGPAARPHDFAGARRIRGSASAGAAGARRPRRRRGRRRRARARPPRARPRRSRGRARPRASPAQALERAEAGLPHLRLDGGAGGPSGGAEPAALRTSPGWLRSRPPRCSRTSRSRTCATARRSRLGSGRGARCGRRERSCSRASPRRSSVRPRCGPSRRCRSRWAPPLLGFRPSERYGALVVDGALLLGSLLALGWPAA